jgi:hypothetical protein
MASNDLLEVSRAVQRAGARGAEGGARGFSCPKDITGSAFLVCIYEGTGEATVVYQASGEHDSMRSPEEKELSKIAKYVDESGVLNEGLLIEDALQREADNLHRANARAVKTLRLFMVRWSLTKLWTFTVSPKAKIDRYDKEAVKVAVNDFFQRWRVLNGGRNFPYAYVLEQHKDGAWHVHVAVNESMFTDFFQLRRVWGHGRIRFDKAKRQAGDPRNDSRRLALYLVKYIVKDIGEHHEKGEHRYEVAQGYRVDVTRRWFTSFQEARMFLMERVKGERFVEVWSDYEIEKWSGPPTWIFNSA